MIHATTFNSTICDYDRDRSIPVHEYRVDYTSPYETCPSTPADDSPFFIIIGLLFLWMTYDIFIKPGIEENKK